MVVHGRLKVAREYFLASSRSFGCCILPLDDVLDLLKLLHAYLVFQLGFMVPETHREFLAGQIDVLQVSLSIVLAIGVIVMLAVGAQVHLALVSVVVCSVL